MDIVGEEDEGCVEDRWLSSIERDGDKQGMEMLTNKYVQPA
jgi:hypothetical protein